MQKSISQQLIMIPVMVLIAIPVLVWADDGEHQANPSQGTLGVRLENSETAGVKVKEVRPGGAADLAGIAQGDLLLTMDGRKLSRPRDVAAGLRGKPAGAEVTVSVWGDGEARPVTVTLAEGLAQENGRQMERRESRRMAPADLDDPNVGPRGGWLGVAVDPGSEDIKGIEVSRVFPGGPAARAGIRKGMVLLALNGQTLHAHDDLKPLLEETEPGEEVTIKVTHGADPELYEEELTVRLGDSRRTRRRSISEDDPLRGSPDYWEDSQDFATQVAPRDFENEQGRRLAEQNERLERLLTQLREDVAALREEVADLRAAQ